MFLWFRAFWNMENSMTQNSHSAAQLTAWACEDSLPIGWLDSWGSFPGGGRKKQKKKNPWVLISEKAKRVNTTSYSLYIQKAGCLHPSRRRIGRRRWADPTHWTCCVWFWRNASSCWFSAETNDHELFRTATVASVQLVPMCHTYIQHVLLNDGVHDDSHQHVEEDGS